MFHLISKHLEFCQKYSTVHPISFQSPCYPCPATERATRTSGGKRSTMTGFLDFQFYMYCACVRIHVSINGNQDSWTSGVTAQVRWITLSQRSLLPVPPLDKGNEDTGNEIAVRRIFNSLLSVWISWWNTVSRLWCNTYHLLLGELVVLLTMSWLVHDSPIYWMEGKLVKPVITNYMYNIWWNCLIIIYVIY